MFEPGWRWFGTTDGDHRALALYLRHYSAAKNRRGKRPGGANWTRIAGPGERLILLTACADALFVWRKERYRRDGERGVNCAVFRNEGPVRSSALIAEACGMAWAKWPGERLFTFVDPRAIRSTNPGWCFQNAGWVRLPYLSKERRLVVLARVP